MKQKHFSCTYFPRDSRIQVLRSFFISIFLLVYANKVKVMTQSRVTSAVCDRETTAPRPKPETTDLKKLE